MSQKKIGANRAQARKNIIINIFAKVGVMILPFATRTVIIYSLGIDYLGLDTLFSSILNVLSLSELGFSSAIVFSMYKPIAEGDDEKVCALLTYYKKIYRIVGCIILGIGLILLPNIQLFIAEGTKYPSDVNLYVVYLIFLSNTCISYFLFAYRSSILVATMRTDIDAIIELVRCIVQYGLQLLVIVLFKQYYIYILVLPFVTVAINIFINLLIINKYPEYCKNVTLEKEEKKQIFSKVKALIGNKIGGMVFTTADNIVISAFLGLEVLGKFSNYNLIFTTVYAIESVAYTSIQPVIGNLLVTKSREECYSIFQKLFLINTCITAVCTACFVSLYQPFMSVWVGKEGMLSTVIPMLFAVYFMVKSIRRLLFLFKEAAGMWKDDFWKPYVSVLVNLIVNIVLVQIIGLPGILISSIVAILVVEIPWETYVFFKKFFEKSPKQYAFLFALAILFSGIVALICGIVAYFTCKIVAYPVLRIAVLFIVCLLLGIGSCIPLLLKSSWKADINNIKKQT